MRGLIVVLLLAASVAGCSDDGAPEAPVDDPPVTEDKGAVRGAVVDASIRPLKGANVTIGTESVMTGEDGAFQFGDLDEGVQRISVTMAGYLPAMQNVQVAAGEILEGVSIILDADTSPQPYHQSYPFNGYADASVGLVNWAVDILVEPFNITTCDCAFHFSTDARPDQFILEVFWEDSIANPVVPTSYYWELYSADYSSFETGYSENPMHVTINGTIYAEGTTDYILWVYPDDIWPAVAQEYEIFLTAFYNGPAPEGWSITNA